MPRALARASLPLEPPHDRAARREGSFRSHDVLEESIASSLTGEQGGAALLKFLTMCWTYVLLHLCISKQRLGIVCSNALKKRHPTKPSCFPWVCLKPKLPPCLVCTVSCRCSERCWFCGTSGLQKHIHVELMLCRYEQVHELAVTCLFYCKIWFTSTHAC